MRRRGSAWGLVAVLGIGCGGGDGGIDEGPKAQPGTVDPTVVRASITQAVGLRTSVTSSMGDALAAGTMSISMSAMQAVMEKGQALIVDPTPQALSIVAADTAQTGTKTCDMTGCTFDKYVVEGGFKVSGSVKASDDPSGGKHVVWDLSGSGLPTGADAVGIGFSDFSYDWKGDLVVSETSLEGKAGGTWTASGSFQGQSFSGSAGSLIKFNALTLASACPTAGNVYVKTWQVARGGGQSQSEAFDGTQSYSGCTN
jgi:hypothetical protein